MKRRRSFRSPTRALFLFAAALVPLSLAAIAARSTDAPPPGSRPEAGPAPLFAELEPAKNPTRLHLQADDGKVVGWVSGAESFAGREVVITCGGEEATARVRGDNTFVWKRPDGKAGAAEVRVGDLRQTVTLPQRQGESEPTVFFVVDRTVYRPGQTLFFAGFLRRLGAGGEFEPLPDREVKVQLVSQAKQTRATELTLTADGQGKISGAYTFGEGAALDDYALSIPGFKGGATVKLAEYRKSKVKLKIEPERKGDKLTLKFEAVDFLEKPVAGTKVSFTAQVVRKVAREKDSALNPEEFAYHIPGLNGEDLWEQLPEDARLLWQAEGIIPPAAGAGGGGAVVAQFTGDIPLKGEEPGTHTLELRPEWLDGSYSVAVQGVVIDANGREQRASRVIPLATDAPGGKLVLPKTTFAVNEPIRVRAVAGEKAGAEGPTTLVVMRLSPGSPAVGVPYATYGRRWARAARIHHLNRLPANGFGGFRPSWRPVQPPEVAKQSLVTAIPFTDGAATVKLAEPGAYKLIAVTYLPDGATRRSEAGCVIQHAADMSALVLELDKEELTAGERLTGTLHSRFDGARVLLTLRNATGIRLTKVVEVKGGARKLDLPLPEGLRYGCSLDAAYLDEDGEAHIAQRYLRVVPADRMLTIKTSVPEEVRPGETVRIGIEVNREEPVDLVVSVYDQALLGIAPDRSVDVRNFYLADGRVRQQMAQELLRRKLQGVTLQELAARAEEVLKNVRPEDGNDPFVQTLQRLTGYVKNKSTWNVYSYDIAAMLRLAGINVYMNPWWYQYYGHAWYVPVDFFGDKPLPLADLLARAAPNDWRLRSHLVRDTIVLQEWHPTGGELPLPLAHPGLMYNQFGFYPYAHGFGGGGFNSQFLTFGNYRGRARGDSHFSISGNSMYSVEGQAFLSHLPGPAGAPVELITADADQGHISVRTDFSDSAFWNANVRTGPDGRASAEFKLPDSLTNWQVVVTAVSRDMHVGHAKERFRTFKPVMVWPMLPRVFTEGDTVEVFASVHNRTGAAQDVRVRLKVENGEVISAPERTVTVLPKGNAPVYWTFRPRAAGFTQLLMTADCPAGSDASLKRLPVTRSGSEQVVTASGMCRDSATIEVPAHVDLSDARLEITLAPSLAADMADTLSYLAEYPYGCVEQTMSRFLPTVKVAQVLRRYHIDHPDLAKKVPGFVAAGVKRLLELQQPDGGWAWHGAGQAHEMMTPYALYGLMEAEKAGYEIPNETAIRRGLQRLRQFIDQMGEAQAADRIYCMYVWSHRNDLEPAWWDFIGGLAEKRQLSDYALALALEMAANKGKPELADRLAEALRGRAKKAGGRVWWETAGFSRWGDDRFEITAAVMKALVAHDRGEPLIDGILAYFAATKHGNRWNSTKSTAMIVYAMCDYLAKENFDPGAKHTVAVTVNGGDAHEVVFDDGLSKKVVVPGSELKEGANRIAFRTRTSGVMYRLVLRYWRRGADVAPMGSGIKVVRNFYLLGEKGEVVRQLKSGDAVPRGSYLLSEVAATNTLGTNMSYLLVEDFKPSCGEYVPPDDPRFRNLQNCTAYVLREERTAHLAYHHEQTPAAVNDRCVILAELAGRYLVPPARVEMMYQTDMRGHSGSFVLNVVDPK